MSRKPNLDVNVDGRTDARTDERTDGQIFGLLYAISRCDKNIKIFKWKIFQFLKLKKSLFIAWASFRNAVPSNAGIMAKVN